MADVIEDKAPVVDQVVTPPANPEDNPPPPSDDPFSAFGFTDEDKDIREWINKTGFKGGKDIAKTAFEQQKLLGSSVRIPGEKATEEERAAFLDKLGRPKEAKDYSFEPPKDLPEDLPYDGERAAEFKGVAHTLGLTDSQAKGLHDWFAGKTVEDFKAMGAGNAEKQLSTAKEQTAILVKEWGPLDGDQMRTNLAFADKALREVGGDEALAEFQRVGLIGSEGKIIQSAPIAKMLAKLGAALYTEDTVLKGRADRLDNPFAEGKSFNVSSQMKVIKEDRDLALSYIAAAGKTPKDFGLKD
jgi:hypothetical protein